MSSDFSDYPDNVRVVSSISEMMQSDFSAEHNVLLMPRQLSGDFNALAHAILEKRTVYSKAKFSSGVRKKYSPYQQKELGMRELDQFFSWTKALEDDPACKAALDQIREDIKALQQFKFKSTIRVERKNEHGFCHLDGKGNKKLHSRVLVNYSGAPTLGYAMSDVLSLPDIGEVVDIREGAKPFNMELGHIWRQCAVENPQSVPFAHSEPIGNTEARLLLVADPYGSDPN